MKCSGCAGGTAKPQAARKIVTIQELPMNLSRRSFLKTASALTVSAVGTGRVLGANEKLNIAVLGAGGRARFLMKALVKVSHVRIAAVCDIWDKHLEQARELADPKAVTSKVYKDILDRK